MTATTIKTGILKCDKLPFAALSDNNSVQLDGTVGEGGGQILRTSLLLSTITGRPFRLQKIRLKRPVPGLRPQHIAAISAFSKATGAYVEGASIGSTSIYFRPDLKVKENVKIDVGTAGSITLILGSIIPALALRGKEVKVTVVGGTDTKWSPTYDYFSNVVKNMYDRIGIKFRCELIRRGYYPAGGGLVETNIYPSKLSSLNVAERINGQVMIKSVCSNLPGHVARRQADSCVKYLEDRNIEVGGIDISMENALSPGSSLLAFIPSSDYFIGSDMVGERGLRAEEIGMRVAESLAHLYSSKASLDSHAADMAIPLLGLAGGKSSFTTPQLTEHMQSNIYVLKQFIDCSINISRQTSYVRVDIDSTGI
ncbi:MAG: RNA 3'-terminal phosphate cyclase [Conexivisphaerales archaeon]